MEQPAPSSQSSGQVQDIVWQQVRHACDGSHRRHACDGSHRLTVSSLSRISESEAGARHLQSHIRVGRSTSILSSAQKGWPTGKCLVRTNNRLGHRPCCPCPLACHLATRQGAQRTKGHPIVATHLQMQMCVKDLTYIFQLQLHMYAYGGKKTKTKKRCVGVCIYNHGWVAVSKRHFLESFDGNKARYKAN